MNLKWSSKSKDDLISIRAFISTDSPSAAHNLIDRIIKTALTLQTSPRSGRKVPEIGMDAIRELIMGNYRIVYELKDDCVYILTIFERHRLFKPSARD